uniref:RNA replicase n=1 Tax=Hubei noda-like virus 14 TaxID=1922970 RepID=A0A1L3KFX7_9VIRU|nr:hypothetical protein [Hubei noda-like virus 14]
MLFQSAGIVLQTALDWVYPRPYQKVSMWRFWESNPPYTLGNCLYDLGHTACLAVGYCQAEPSFVLQIMKYCGFAFLVFLLTVCAYYGYWARRFHVAFSVAIYTAFSRLVDRFCYRVNSGRRNHFNRSFKLSEFRTRWSHSHPTAAGRRTAADISINDYILKTGKVPYNISPASRNDDDGYRSYYFSKDYVTRQRHDTLTGQHIIKMVDVDYYLSADEFEYWLSAGNPVVMYTFCPLEAGGSVPDGSYTIDANNRVTLNVNGGGRYTHELWDWGMDHFTIETWAGVWIVFIDSIEAGSGWRIIQLTPMVWVPAPLSWAVPRYPMTRRAFSHQAGQTAWVSVTAQNSDGVQMFSLARAGTDYSLTIPLSCYQSLLSRHRYAKSNRNVGDIMAHLDVFTRKGLTNCDSAIAAPMLYEYFEADPPKLKVHLQTLGAFATHYQYQGPRELEVPRLYARDVGPKIIDAGYFPGISMNNEYLTIADRVRACRNTVVPPSCYSRYLNEFLEMLVPVVGGLRPISVSDVMEEQDRPLQKIRNEQAKTWLYSLRKVVKAFQKRETCKLKAPRNISTLSTDLNLKYSTYVRSFKQSYLTNLPWYVPGKSPSFIARAVCRIATTASHLLSSDFSNLDGSKSDFLRGVYRACLLRAFGDDPALVDLLGSTYYPTCVTRHGILYDAGPSQLSGSADTTDNNTVAVAFWVYCGYRKWGISPGDSWSFLQDSLVCGDDVLCCMPPECARTAAEELGLTLKVDVVRPGEPLTFLGRVFVDPWTTDNSIQDPVRTLSKIHTSVADFRKVTPEAALRWKAAGYLVNDRFTPLISHYCHMVLRLQGLTEVPVLADAPEAVRVDLPWWAIRSFEDGTGTWPHEKSERLWSIVASKLGLTIGELAGYCEVLDNLTVMQELPVLRRPTIEPTAPVMVDGELVEPVDPPLSAEVARGMVAHDALHTADVGIQCPIIQEDAPFITPKKKGKGKKTKTSAASTSAQS